MRDGAREGSGERGRPGSGVVKDGAREGSGERGGQGGE